MSSSTTVNLDECTTLSRAQRQLRLVAMLHTNSGLDTEQLCEALHVSRRTLFRDLRALADAGIRCTYDPKQGAYIAGSNGNERSSHSRLSTQETLAILALIRTHSAIKRPAVCEAIACAAAKLRESLPATVTDGYERMLREIAVCLHLPRNGSQFEEVIETVLQEADESREIAVGRERSLPA